jgi:methionyl-tRNA formyltransferase
VLAVVEGVGAVVATGGCPLLLREGQLEGKRPARGEALLQQLALRVGEPLSDQAGEPRV